MSDIEGTSTRNLGKSKGKSNATVFSTNPHNPLLHKDNPEAPLKVDEETDNWPISNELQKDLCKIKRTHYVQPLRAYIDDRFVEPNDVNGILANALVEVHFSLKHYHIQREGDKGFDSFTAHIEQINVLKRGAPKAPNPYKRHNPRVGPLQVKRAKISIQSIEPSTSAPKGTYNIEHS
jgi:hypothetical protein